MVDILVLGATGFTGRLVTRYLASHPQRSSFSFAIGVRSKSKGEALKASLGISEDDSIQLVQVDVAQYEDVEAAVKGAKVVLNTVGPYWLWGTNVVRACAVYGKRYVDLTGELHFVRKIIDQYDYLATKTGAIIVPSCGFDSIPGDILVYISNRTLKNALGPGAQLGLSQTFYEVRGGFSGGTAATLVTEIEMVPRPKLAVSRLDYAVSPVRGHPSPPTQSAVRIPFTSPTEYGAYWIMSTGNRGIVQRSFGLFELLATHARTLSGLESAKEKEAQIRPLTYGPQFRYAEYMVHGHSRFAASLFSGVLSVFFALLFFVPPVQWLLKMFIPKPGEGPSEKEMENGFMTVTNYTESATAPDIMVKSVMRGDADPGYLLTSLMISECALALVLDDASLPPSAHLGGVLTPATAFGSVIVSRLMATGRMHFDSQIVRGHDESKKDR